MMHAHLRNMSNATYSNLTNGVTVMTAIGQDRKRLWNKVRPLLKRGNNERMIGRKKIGLSVYCL